jgi:hypothetical protein
MPASLGGFKLPKPLPRPMQAPVKAILIFRRRERSLAACHGSAALLIEAILQKRSTAASARPKALVARKLCHK